MKISVIIPTFNAERYIGRCIDSVKAQTHEDWECIVVDDGSTDGTAAELLKLTDGDGRFKVEHREKNEGVAAARNRGIAKAKGDALFFLDADDWLDADALAIAADEASAFPKAGRIFMQPNVFHEGSKQSRVWSVRPLGLHKADSLHLFKDATCDVGHCTGSLYVLKNLPNRPRFPKGVRVYEDMLFNMGLIFAGVSTVIIGRIPYHYTKRDGSLVSSELTEKDEKDVRRAFVNLTTKFHPSREIHERCQRFMDKTLERRHKMKAELEGNQ